MVMSLVLSVNVSLVSASEPTSYTEDELNTIFRNAGFPEDLIASIDSDKKQYIVNNSGQNFAYTTYSSTEFVHNTETGDLEEVDTPASGEIGAMDIPRSELIVETLPVKIITGGVTYYDIYGSFTWVRNPKISPDGIYKDHIAIAVPDGYEIQDNAYTCAAQRYDYTASGGWAWTSPNSSWCGSSGQPTTYPTLYGAGWQFLNTSGTAVPGLKYKGTAKLRVRKVDSGAINRAITSYNEARNSALGNYNVSVSFGPASISFSPTQGTSDKGEDDAVWTN
jgi:hypothetical protein